MPRLPRAMLKERLRSELESCRRELNSASYKFDVVDTAPAEFPVIVQVSMLDVRAPIMTNDILRYSSRHRFTLELTREYPYRKPLVRWCTRIFHPNIAAPEEGGRVCTRLLEDWNPRSDLLTFIRGIETLLAHPNPKCPLDTDTCTRAAEYYNKKN